MRPGRVIALVVGCLLLLPGIAMLFGGGGLGLAYAFGRDDDGYFEATPDRLETSTVAITAEDLTLGSDPGSPDEIVDALDVDIRLRATNADSGRPVFIGIAEESDVDAYLAGTAHAEVDDVDDGAVSYRTRSGGDEIAAPGDQRFWAATATGEGTQEITWEATSGRWAAVLMNADGTPGVATDVDVGAKAGFVLPLALLLLAGGLVLTVGATTLIVVGATGVRTGGPASAGDIAGAEETALAAPVPPGPSPVRLGARLDPDLSRWQWLVKWLLAIPHFLVLIFLWIALVVLTVVAGISILVTGTYPRAIFDFNVGVLRWSWRVSYYATSGGLGTDRYPPFSLRPEDGDLATLDIAYPERLSRGLVLVKWWLLAIPHYLILGILLGGSAWWITDEPGGAGGGPGLLGLLVIVAAVILLFTDRYPRSLFDLIIGLSRWVYRVVAYAALMTDEYPPFRLDQGGAEPNPEGPEPPSQGPGAGDVRSPEDAPVRDVVPPEPAGIGASGERTRTEAGSTGPGGRR